MTLAEVCNCVRRMHSDLRQRVNEDTLLSYQKAFTSFTDYLQRRYDVLLTTAEDLDQLLMEYRTEAELTRAQHVRLVASTEFFLPHVKGRLIYSREALKGRASAEPVKHTIPLTFECALLFAAWHASSGRTRLGAAVLIQHATGMRPSELLALKPEHIHLPLARTSAITVRLGATYSTKVKREQYILVDPIIQSIAYSLLARLCITTPTHQRLFPFGYNVYNMSFKQAEGHYGLSLGTTAHSGRAGFATHSVMQGVPRKEIQAQGRWLSESSFNTYIDVAGASHIAAQVNTKQLASTARWIESRIWKYFDLPNPSDVKSQPQCISGSIGTETRLPLSFGQRPHPRAPTGPISSSAQCVASDQVGRASWNSGPSQRAVSARDRPSTKGKGRGSLRRRGDSQHSIFD